MPQHKSSSPSNAAARKPKSTTELYEKSAKIKHKIQEFHTKVFENVASVDQEPYDGMNILLLTLLQAIYF